MRRLLLAATALVGFAPASAQQFTRSMLYQQNATGILAAPRSAGPLLTYGAVNPTADNGMFTNVIRSMGVLADDNGWSGVNSFSGTTTFTGPTNYLGTVTGFATTGGANVFTGFNTFSVQPAITGFGPLNGTNTWLSPQTFNSSATFTSNLTSSGANTYTGTSKWAGSNESVSGPGELFWMTNDGVSPEAIVGPRTFNTFASVIENNASTSLYNSNAIGAFGRNYAAQVSNQNNLVGVYSNVSSMVPGAGTWSFNGLCNIPISTVASTACDGMEMDINNSAAGGIGNAFIATGASTNSGNFSAFAVQWLDQQNYPSSNNTIKWYAGLYEQDGSVTYGAQFAAQQISGANVNGAPILYNYFDGSGVEQTYQEFASTGRMQHLCSASTCDWAYQGAVELYAGSGLYDSYLSASGHAASFGSGVNITGITISNGTAPVTISGNLAAAQVTANTLLNLNYAGGSTCTVTGSIGIKINGSVHSVPYC